MLSRRESEVMNAVYSLCHERGVCLISPAELMALLPVRKRYTEDKLEEVLNELALDEYFDLLSSERKGEKCTCFRCVQKVKRIGGAPYNKGVTLR